MLNVVMTKTKSGKTCSASQSAGTSPIFGLANAGMINHSPFKYSLQAALLSGCLFFFSCENDPEVVNRTHDEKANIEEARNVESFLSQNGNLRAKLVAPFMLRYAMDTSYLEFPKTLHVNFYDSSGK